MRFHCWVCFFHPHLLIIYKSRFGWESKHKQGTIPLTLSTHTVRGFQDWNVRWCNKSPTLTFSFSTHTLSRRFAEKTKPPVRVTGLSRQGRDPASPARRAGDTHREGWTDGWREREWEQKLRKRRGDRKSHRRLKHTEVQIRFGSNDIMLLTRFGLLVPAQHKFHCHAMPYGGWTSAQHDPMCLSWGNSDTFYLCLLASCRFTIGRFLFLLSVQVYLFGAEYVVLLCITAVCGSKLVSRYSAISDKWKIVFVLYSSHFQIVSMMDRDVYIYI